MADRTLTISSAGKTFSVTGWKVGWVCAPEPLVRAVNTAKQFLTFTSGAPLQPAVAAALALPEDYFATLRDGLQAKCDRLCAGLREVGMDVFEPQGTYFATSDVRPLGFADGVEFCRELPHRCGVVAIPHRVFYDDQDAGRSLVRWAFCKGDDVIDARDGCSYIPEQMPEVIRDTVYCGPGHDTVYTDNDGDGRLEYGEDRVSGCERVILAPQSPPEEEGT
jgi:N-succinyldiaminopimelate aminotransferase